MKITRTLLLAGVTALCLLSSPSRVSAQTVYEWNGSISSDWATAGNWTATTTDVLGTITVAPATLPPDLTTNVEIGPPASPSTLFPVLSSGVQAARRVEVGTAAGVGRLDITGGSLEIEVSGSDDDFEIGADSNATVNINDASGPVTVTIGDDLNLDRGAGADYDSVLTVSGDVTIDVNDLVELGSSSDSDYLVDIQGGTLLAGDDVRVRGGAGSELRVSGGLVETADRLDVDTLLTIQGDGIVRAERLFGPGDFLGSVVITGDGALQVRLGGDTSLSELQGQIDDGTFSTVDSGFTLGISTVSVADFAGSATPTDFYQVSVVPVPEPSSAAVLIGMLSLACVRGSLRK